MTDPQKSVATLAEIYHFEQMTSRIGSSGQPLADQFSLIAEAGYRGVINLAMPDSDNAIPTEGRVVSALGMAYHHIPVPFDAPDVHHLGLFCKVMRAHAGDRVWVHCVVNARVSAFLYQYLRLVEGVEEEHAKSELLKRWLPSMDSVWLDFLALDASDLKKAGVL